MRRSESGGRLAGIICSGFLLVACGGSPDSTDSARTTSGATAAPTSTSSSGAGNDPEATGMTYRLRAIVGPDGSPMTPPPGATPVTPAAITGAQCPAGLAIAVAGPHTGDLEVIGGATLRGAQLAVAEFTAANPACPVTLKPFDTAGAGGPAGAAAAIVADPSVVAVVGPSTSDDLQATGTTFAQAGLAAVSPSATLPDLADAGFSTFLRGLANDEQVAIGTASSLAGGIVCVAHAGPPIDPAVALAPVVTDALGTAAQPSCDSTLTYQQDLGPVVDAVAAAAPSAVYLLTVMPQAAEFVQALRSAGVQSTVYVSDLAYLVDYLAEVGVDGANTVLVCACELPTPEFADTYAAKFGTDEPAMWAPEGYELASIALRGIATGAAGDRAAMLQYLRGFDGWGAGRHYQWAPTGELTSPASFQYDVVPAA